MSNSEFTYELLLGNSLEVLKSIEDESVQMCVTSPPYFNLRDYGSDKQIGNEDTVEKYIGNLIAIFEEVKRVLKNDGSLYVNIGDTYGNKSLLCVPDIFKVEMVKNGWICRNEIIWRKPNAMPSSAKDRFNTDFEKVFFFTKSEKYLFNTQYEPRKSTATISAGSSSGKYEDSDNESKYRQGMNSKRGTKLIFIRKELPSQKRFVDFMRSRTSIDQIEQNSGIKRTKIEHWFRYDVGGFSFPSVEDWNEIKWLVDDYSTDFSEIDYGLTEQVIETDDIEKNSKDKRICRAVWDINTKPLKEKHFAPFPEKLVEIPIKASSNERDIVLDCFAGSGTTGCVCKYLNRNFIGIDVNADFIEIANKRINEYIPIQEVPSGQMSFEDLWGENL